MTSEANTLFMVYSITAEPKRGPVTAADFHEREAKLTDQQRAAWEEVAKFAKYGRDGAPE